MKLLLDTHLLLWAAGEPERLPAPARALLNAPENELFFSAASLWEVAIKHRLDRILIAQATVEGITLLTADPLVAEYTGPVWRA